MERLRSSRSQLVDHFRSAGDAINNNNSNLETAMRVQDVMEVEWVALSPDSGFPPSRCVSRGKGCGLLSVCFGVNMFRKHYV